MLPNCLYVYIYFMTTKKYTYPYNRGIGCHTCHIIALNVHASTEDEIPVTGSGGP
jgi:hypothetical protein